MLLQIGGRLESDFDHPLGMLADCHKRIQRFLKALIAAAGNSPAAAFAPEQLAPLQTALRYFRESAPKHTADEEDSLFPRMRRLDSPQVRGALGTISRIESDHRDAERKHAEIDRIFSDWIRHGGIPKETHAKLNSILAGLAAHYDEHIAFEEREIFPAAAQALPDTEKQAVGIEMAARRGISFRPKDSASPA